MALGAIAFLALTTTEAPVVALTLLFGGWIAMPSLLAMALDQPRWRYLLIVPATMVGSGLLIVIAGLSGSTRALMGWWLIAAGVLFGAGLGGWFWYRWMPVPLGLSDPFSRGRWALIGVHVGLILAGMALVLAG